MKWKAVDKIDEAVTETRELLFPFNPGLWIKLALLTLMTGSGLTTTFFRTPLAMESQIQQIIMHTSVPQFSNLLFPVLGLILSLSFLIIILNSIAEFALFDTLLTKKAKLSKYFKENIGRGLRYTVYRLIILLIAVGVSASAVLVFSLNPLLGFIALMFFVPVFVLLLVFDILIRDFVLLEMLEEEKGFSKSIQSVYNNFRPQWKEVIAYLVVRIVMVVAIGIGVATAVGFTGLIFAVPGVMLLILMEISLLFVLPLMVLSMIAVTVMIAIMMPFHVYLYNYKIEVYEALKN